MNKFDKQLLAGWIFGLSIVLWAMIASADHLGIGPQWAQKPVQCASPAEVLEMLEDEDMEPLMQMAGNIRIDDGMYSVPFVLYYNSDTTAWYLVEYTNFEQACVVGVGEGVSFDVQDELVEDGPPHKRGT